MTYRNVFSLSACFLLTGCNLAERLSNVGEPPELSQIQNPHLVDNYEDVTMPMPEPERQESRINSLWQSGSRAFFKDQRARQVGDILTVKIDLESSAELSTDYNSKRTTTNNSSLSNFFGYEKYLGKIFPSTVNKDKLTNVAATSDIESTGNKKKRKDTLKIELAANIIQILPNGNFVIQGRQDVRVAGELKTIELKGIIRPEDIISNNIVTYDKVAEARISSVSKGEISDLAKTPWGQETLNKVLPF